MNSDQSFKDDWRMKLPRHFAKAGDRQRAIEIAQRWIKRCGVNPATEMQTEMALVARELINATERQDAVDVGVIELPPFPFHREA